MTEIVAYKSKRLFHAMCYNATDECLVRIMQEEGLMQCPKCAGNGFICVEIIAGPRFHGIAQIPCPNSDCVALAVRRRRLAGEKRRMSYVQIDAIGKE